MHTNRITFYLGPTGLPSWLIKSIHKQVKHFEGEAALVKISSLQHVDVKDYLNILTLALHPFDLCQIVLKSKDTNQLSIHTQALQKFLQQECLVLSPETIPTTKKITDLGLFQSQVFDITKELASFLKLYSLVNDTSTDLHSAEKKFCLRWIAKFAQTQEHDELEQQLNQRESLSSTAMRGGVALPHVMSECITTPQLVVLTSKTAIDWGSAFGPVTHIVALLIPKQANQTTLYAVRHLATALINQQTNEFICQHHSQLELQAILSCLMKLQ